MTNASHRMVVLVGGARSGKSNFADNCGRAFSRVIYFATAQRMVGGADAELEERIAKHVALRPKQWKTMEPPASVDDLLNATLTEKPDAVIVDCATLWLGWEMSRVFAQYNKTQLVAHMENEMRHFVDTLRKIPCPVFVVSNETGCGVVPEHASGRVFRDCQGLLNAALAAHSLFTIVFFAGQGILVKNANGTGTAASGTPTTPATPSASTGYFPVAAVTPEWVASQLLP